MPIKNAGPLTPQTGRAISRPSKIESAEAIQTASLDLGIVWGAAWQTLVARALPMLGFVFMGCAATWALALFAITPGLSIGAVLQMIAGTLALSFAQGGITWLALHSSGASAGFVAACHAAFRRWPTLLFGSLIYSTVIMAGAIGVGLALRYARINVPPTVHIPHPYTMNWQMHGLATNAAHSFVTQSASALIPDPGVPFGAWLPTLRAAAFLHEVEVKADTRAATHGHGSIYSVVSIYTPGQHEFWWITAGSVGLLLVAEVLLRLRMAFVMGADRPIRVTVL